MGRIGAIVLALDRAISACHSRFADGCNPLSIWYSTTNRFPREGHDAHTNMTLQTEMNHCHFSYMSDRRFRPDTKAPVLLISSCSNRSSLFPSNSFFYQSNDRIVTRWTYLISRELFSDRRMDTIGTDQNIDDLGRILCFVSKMHMNLIVSLFERRHVRVPSYRDIYHEATTIHRLRRMSTRYACLLFGKLGRVHFENHHAWIVVHRWRIQFYEKVCCLRRWNISTRMSSKRSRPTCFSIQRSERRLKGDVGELCR